MKQSLLSVENISRHYRLPRRRLLDSQPVLTAVDGASFQLERGETLGIVGESGSGKSTLAKMVMAFEKPDQGRVLFNGSDINQMSAVALKKIRRHFQMVFQDPFGSLDPRRKVGWSIAEPLRAMATDSPSGINDRISAALQQVGLQARDADKYPHEFSGGQRQRIAIARAIVTRPALLVADEAVSALDVSVQAQILNLLMDLKLELGLGILFISHDLAVVASICDRILVMQNGRIVETGPTAQVLANPAHEYTGTLLAAARI